MKRSIWYSALIVFLSLSSVGEPAYGQNRPTQEPMFIRPLTHPPGLGKVAMPARSFYNSKGDWQRIIDSTWGPGLSYQSKLALFDSYVYSLSKDFDGFLSLGLNGAAWDSVRKSYRATIDSTTSRGRFASIMAQFAMRLRDAHTWAWDTVVTFTPLSPGVPLLVLYPFATAEHFGAVLTSLPDSTALIVRTVPNHPLGLQPGDIVLGYEGVPWMHQLRELLDAKVPVYGCGVGAQTAETNALVRNVGNNWHMFETIDVLKHSTRDTVHLSVTPLLTLPADPMMGNEQMEIPGIPFSFYAGWPFGAAGTLLAYGKLPSANIGYIRLLGEWPSNAADAPFAAAVDSLWNTDGLIIDMRWNSGGWALFPQAFARMFSEPLYTTEDLIRASGSTFDLVPYGNVSEAFIPGTPGSIFDRPIAILMGPTCVSLGDWMSQRLRYHPMVRFFGRSSIASLGYSTDVTGSGKWWLRHSITDVYHLSQPGVTLNRREFPIDEPVWFNPDDVAQGLDPVLVTAVRWINTLSYSHDVRVAPRVPRKEIDTLHILATVRNPQGHSLTVSAFLKDLATGLTQDSLLLFNDGLHGDGLANDTTWGAMIVPMKEAVYGVKVTTVDATSGTSRSLPDAALFATAGPLKYAGFQFADPTSDTALAPGATAIVKIGLKNIGATSAIAAVTGRLTAIDSGDVVGQSSLSWGSITAGRVKYSNSSIGMKFWSGRQGGSTASFAIDIYSSGTLFWRDTIRLALTGVGDGSPELPVTYSLEQNYPNPFNPTTVISAQWPASCQVRLAVYDLLGQEVATLADGRYPAGRYRFTFDGSNLASGIYFYRLKASPEAAGGPGEFLKTLKFVILR